jgi:hypothetical protein
MEHEEVVVDEHIPYEEQIEPFDWEDYLYESWLEENLRREKRKPAEAGI